MSAHLMVENKWATSCQHNNCAVSGLHCRLTWRPIHGTNTGQPVLLHAVPGPAHSHYYKNSFARRFSFFYRGQKPPRLMLLLTATVFLINRGGCKNHHAKSITVAVFIKKNPPRKIALLTMAPFIKGLPRLKCPSPKKAHPSPI